MDNGAMTDTGLRQLTLLLVEDDRLLRQAVSEFLAPHCQKVIPAANGREALEIFQRESPDLVLTDIIMPELDGLTMTEEMRRISPQTPVIFHSAFSDTPYLLRGIELGVAGFVAKPCAEGKLLTTLQQAAIPVLQRQQLAGLRSELRQSIEQLIGFGPKQKGLTDQVVRIARSSYAILVQGETGSGKSRLASIIHDLSPRASKPFVTVQLSTLPESLVAAELFGHEKGAFTGADRRRAGLVGAATGGTLFLDDIDAASPVVQALLLQLVEDKSYYPLGGNRKVVADLRVIAASNRDLADAVASGHFRQDLYYRLATFLIDMPPLRSTIDEIPHLAAKFLRENCLELGRPPLEIRAEAILLLQSHPWHGNIRELRNAMKRAAIMAGEVIDAAIVHAVLSNGPPTPADRRQSPSSPSPAVPATPSHELPMTMAAVEQWALQRALKAAKGKKMVAARLLDMNYYTFKRHLERHGLAEDSSE
jgi:DNA-binding NtrC family response regulator